MGISKKLLDEVKKVYGQKIQDKHKNISVHASEFINKHFPEDSHQIIISGSQITDVVYNYFVDIHRFKERRGMDVGNAHISDGKIAAFTAKWIVRLRPICVEPINAEHILGMSFNDRLYRELAFEFRQKKLSETQLYMTFEQASGFYARP